jgi:inosine-uridine nucleoside N-ribohydrolase
MAVALDRSVILESVRMFAVVELNGSNTRGMLVADWRNRLCKPPNVTLVKKTDREKAFALWRGMVLE